MSDLHTLVGSYVVDALEDVDRSAFEQHLAECAECLLEVAEFGETLAELSRAVAVPPPAGLRASVLSAIQGVRALPPERATEAPAEPASGQVPPVEPAGSGGEQSAEGAGGEDELAARRGRRRSRWLVALVAAALIAVLGIGGVAVNLARQVQQEQAQAAAAAELLSAPDAQVYTGTVQGQPVSFVVSKQRNQAMFVGTGLPSPGADKTYQLWTIPPDADPRPDILVGGGDQQEFLTGDVADAAALAVSIEDAGGAVAPTADQIQLITEL